MRVDYIIRKANRTTAVVYQDRCGAGEHIVRVEVGDGEVEAVVGLGEGVDGSDKDDGPGRGFEVVARM